MSEPLALTTRHIRAKRRDIKKADSLALTDLIHSAYVRAKEADTVTLTHNGMTATIKGKAAQAA